MRDRSLPPSYESCPSTPRCQHTSGMFLCTSSPYRGSGTGGPFRIPSLHRDVYAADEAPSPKGSFASTGEPTHRG